MVVKKIDIWNKVVDNSEHPTVTWIAPLTDSFPGVSVWLMNLELMDVLHPGAHKNLQAELLQHHTAQEM